MLLLMAFLVKCYGLFLYIQCFLLFLLQGLLCFVPLCSYNFGSYTEHEVQPSLSYDNKYDVEKVSKLNVVSEVTKCMRTVFDTQYQGVRNYLLTFGPKIR